MLLKIHIILLLIGVQTYSTHVLKFEEDAKTRLENFEPQKNIEIFDKEATDFNKNILTENGKDIYKETNDNNVDLLEERTKRHISKRRYKSRRQTQNNAKRGKVQRFFIIDSFRRIGTKIRNLFRNIGKLFTGGRRPTTTTPPPTTTVSTTTELPTSTLLPSTTDLPATTTESASTDLPSTTTVSTTTESATSISTPTTSDLSTSAVTTTEKEATTTENQPTTELNVSNEDIFKQTTNKEKYIKILTIWASAYKNKLNEHIEKVVNEKLNNVSGNDKEINKDEGKTDKTYSNVKAHTIYENRVGSGHVTNIFIFYPNARANKTMEPLNTINNTTTSSIKDSSDVTESTIYVQTPTAAITEATVKDSTISTIGDKTTASSNDDETLDNTESTILHTNSHTETTTDTTKEPVPTTGVDKSTDTQAPTTEATSAAHESKSTESTDADGSSDTATPTTELGTADDESIPTESTDADKSSDDVTPTTEEGTAADENKSTESTDADKLAETPESTSDDEKKPTDATDANKSAETPSSTTDDENKPIDATDADKSTETSDENKPADSTDGDNLTNSTESDVATSTDEDINPTVV